MCYASSKVLKNSKNSELDLEKTRLRSSLTGNEAEVGSGI